MDDDPLPFLPSAMDGDGPASFPQPCFLPSAMDPRESGGGPAIAAGGGLATAAGGRQATMVGGGSPTIAHGG